MSLYYDVITTQPYLTNAMTWVHNDDELDNSKPLFYFLTENIPFYHYEELVEIYDLEYSLKDLSNNGDISIFTDPYMAQLCTKIRIK